MLSCPPPFLLWLYFPPTPQSEAIFSSPVSPGSPSPSPLKWLGLVSSLEGGCFTNSVSSQLFLKNTITNMIAAARGSVLRWKMRYKIYLRFLVFDKIESSHFNCSRLGVLLQATGKQELCMLSLVLSRLLCSIVQNADYDLLYPCHLSYLGSFR